MPYDIRPIICFKTSVFEEKGYKYVSPDIPGGGDIQISYDADWSTKKTVTITAEGADTTSQYKLMYAVTTIGEEPSSGDWQLYEKPFDVEQENAKITAKLVERTGEQQEGEYATANITTIDHSGPVLSDVTLNVKRVTHNSIELNITGTAIDNGAGLEENPYEYYLESDIKKDKTKDVTYTYDGLTEEKEYNLVVRVYDKLNNYSEKSLKQTTEPFAYNIGTPQSVKDYGKKVTTYTAGGQTWRLFYQDEKATYLISDTEVTKTTLNGSNIRTEMSKVGKILNPSWTNINMSLNNSKGIAYLCDTTAWATYCDESLGARYAIGGPTLDLFVKSFNATHPDNQYTISTTSGNYGLWVTDNVAQKLLTTDNNGIYNKASTGDNTTYWWMASPYYRVGDNVLGVHGPNGNFIGSDDGSVNHSYGIRPIVCIPTTDFTEKHKVE